MQKINFTDSYIGGGNFFHTVNGEGRLIHLSPDFNEELFEKNLNGGFFDMPDNCNKCIIYMFHLKNTNKKTVKNIIIKFKIKGKIFDPIIKFVNPGRKIANYEYKNNLYQMSILHLSTMETLNFGVLTTGPGDLIETSCDIKNGSCAINHFGLFYNDIKTGNKKVFLNYNNKEYPLPDINNSSEKKDYQLINGVWAKYK